MKKIPANSIIIYNTDSKFKQLINTIRHLITGKPIKENYVIQYILEDTFVYDKLDNAIYYRFNNDTSRKFNLNLSKILKTGFKNFRNDWILNYIGINNGDVDVMYSIDTPYNTAICLIEYSGNWQRSTI